MVQLPWYYDRWVRLWAMIKGQPKAVLMSNIVQARVEANKEDIGKALDEIAEANNVARSDLEREWLGEDEPTE